MTLTSTQDSSSTSKITLHQILDIYLRLCHNDGMDKPEALYLALTSKLAVDSELDRLSAAANEGKGLSQVDTWDEVDEDGVPVQEGPPPAYSAEESHVDQTYPDQSLPQSSESVQGEASHEDESLNAKAVETAHEEAGFAPSAADHEVEVEAHSHNVVEDVQDAEAEKAHLSRPLHDAQPTHDDDQDDRYDSEAHKTESSATVVEATATNEHADHVSAGDIEGAVEQDVADDLVGDGANLEEFDQEQPESVNFEEHDDFAYEESLTEENEDHDQIIHEHESIHEADVAPEDESASAANFAGDDERVSHHQPESTVETVAQEDAADQENTPEPEDDLLDIPEDLVQAPAKNQPEGRHDHTEEAHPEQFDEYEDEEHANDDELAAPATDQDGADDHQSAEDFDDYYPPPDLEVTEALELGGIDLPHTDTQNHDNLSVKRSRDEEEEEDIADTTTPDTKRRRS